MAACGIFPAHRPPVAGFFAVAAVASLAGFLFAPAALAAPPAFDTLVAGQPSLFPGQTTVIDARVTDSDPITTWTWTASLGTVEGSGASAVFTAPRTPAVATITCTVTDATGATASGTVTVTTSDVFPERILSGGFKSPARVSISRSGEVYVADPSLGGIAVTGLFTPGVHRFLELRGARSVAVDWKDGIAVAGDPGAAVYTSTGQFRFVLDPGAALGSAWDVATDLAAARYAVLWGDAGRIAVHAAGGALLFSFGQIGDGAGQLKGATSVAFTPRGDILVGDAGHGNIKLFSGADGSFMSITYGRPPGSMGGISADRFSGLSGIVASPSGTVFGVDTFYSRFSSFDSTGTVREAVGAFGDGVGQFRSPAGIAVSDVFRRIVVASVNSSRLDVFRMDGLGESMPLLAVSTTAIDFGSRIVGSFFAGPEIVLTSAGTAPVTLSRLRGAGDFSVISSTCGLSLAPGASCRATLAFQPSVAGVRTAALAIGNNAQVQPQFVTLTGFGALDPAASTRLVIVGDGAFYDQPAGTASPMRTVVVTNEGTGFTGDLSVAITGPGAAASQIASNGCSGPLAPGASCTLGVVFAPDSSGSFTATLAVTDVVAPLSTATLPLSGNGTLAAAAIPGLSLAGLLALALALAATGTFVLGRRSL